jgi:outer membrane protein OmpA-like peptidoglycan-associated protein
MSQETTMPYPRSVLTALLLGAAVSACASTAPKELAYARTAYDRASHGSTAQRAPAELHKARSALNTAEQAFEDEGDSQIARDLAYVALRKVQLADVTAVRAEQADVKEQSDLVFKQAQAQKQVDTTQALAQSQAQLSASQQIASAAQSERDALTARLSELANVKEDERGTVVSLSGSLLFPSGKASLTPVAQERLRGLSEAIMSAPERRINIEGFTDSRGSEQRNMTLSQQRADAVRRYLVSQGLPPDRVQAEGKGESQPIASNDDPEGRANNRRVEIVLESQK